MRSAAGMTSARCWHGARRMVCAWRATAAARGRASAAGRWRRAAGADRASFESFVCSCSIAVGHSGFNERKLLNPIIYHMI